MSNLGEVHVALVGIGALMAVFMTAFSLIYAYNVRELAHKEAMALQGYTQTYSEGKLLWVPSTTLEKGK